MCLFFNCSNYLGSSPPCSLLLPAPPSPATIRISGSRWLRRRRSAAACTEKGFFKDIYLIIFCGISRMWVLQIRASDQRKRIESKRLKAREIEYSSFFVTSKMCLTSIISSSPSSSNSRLRSLSVESELSRRRRSIFVLIQILDWMFQVPSLRETSGRQQQRFLGIGLSATAAAAAEAGKREFFPFPFSMRLRKRKKKFGSVFTRLALSPSWTVAVFRTPALLLYGNCTWGKPEKLNRKHIERE